MSDKTTENTPGQRSRQSLDLLKKYVLSRVRSSTVMKSCRDLQHNNVARQQGEPRRQLLDRFEELRVKIEELSSSVVKSRSAVAKHWLLFTFLPAAVLPVGVILVKEHLIDAPKERVELEYRLLRHTAGQIDRNYIVVGNAGNKAVNKEEGHLIVRFKGVIESMPRRESYTHGTYPIDTAGERMDSCEKKRKCKLMLGLLTKGGTLVVQFNSKHVLTDFPQIDHGGNLIGQPCACKGLPEDLQQLCPKEDSCKIDFNRSL